jgi:fibronectin type 3 domain-containing protein
VQSVHIFRSNDALKNFKETGSVKGADTTFNDANVMPDKMYFYYLVARDRTGKELKRSSTFFESAFEKSKSLTPQIVAADGLKNGVKLTCIVPDKFITGIKIYRAQGANTNFEVVQDFYATHDSARVVFIDSSKVLTGRSTYSYYIVSQNSSSVFSEKSNVIQAQPAIPTEAPASGFLRVYFQDGRINLSWLDMKMNDPMVKGYLVSRQEAGTNNWKNIFSNDSVFAGSHYEDAKFEEGKVYEYKIETVDQFGGKSKTAPTGSVSIPVSKLSPAAGLKAISLPDGIELEWSPSGDENISGYKVYRYQRGSQPAKVGNTNANTRNYLDKTAAKGELYFYYIIATDTKQRDSDPSAEVGARK